MVRFGRTVQRSWRKAVVTSCSGAANSAETGALSSVALGVVQ